MFFTPDKIVGQGENEYRSSTHPPLIQVQKKSIGVVDFSKKERLAKPSNSSIYAEALAPTRCRLELFVTLSLKRGVIQSKIFLIER
ncbi:hypothetical protein [Coxiella endosymbiont of Ornithodoros amblus]|uniref:hypothetical protein n=1 Tax=Coxiella endosymbiont of Ornithodoros amblus TaxID=1656166 RepID=UPI00244DA221|nr:hypothetical protein [Coxiella endosymbiont of Ornithodoros amblus]